MSQDNVSANRSGLGPGASAAIYATGRHPRDPAPARCSGGEEAWGRRHTPGPRAWPGRRPRPRERVACQSLTLHTCCGGHGHALSSRCGGTVPTGQQAPRRSNAEAVDGCESHPGQPVRPGCNPATVGASGGHPCAVAYSAHAAHQPGRSPVQPVTQPTPQSPPPRRPPPARRRRRPPSAPPPRPARPTAAARRTPGPRFSGVAPPPGRTGCCRSW